MSKAMEKESKHTPGPWRIAWDTRRRSAEIETVTQEDGKYRHMTNDLPMVASLNDPVEIITGEDGREYKYSAEACANVRLMAAAPELLDALGYASELIKTARRYFPKSIRNSDRFQLENTCAAIGKAIAKVEGKQ